MNIDNHYDVPRSPKELVEFLAIVHLGIASSEDLRISAGNSPVYKGSEKAFKAMIHIAYPELSEESIYDCWCACNESIEYCAEQIGAEIKAAADTERLNALEDSAWEAGETQGKEDARNQELNGVQVPSMLPVPDAFIKEAAQDYREGHNFGMREYYRECARLANESE